MFKCERSLGSKVLAVLIFCLFAGNVLTQNTTCLYISEEAGPHANDVIIVDWLRALYDVEIATGDDVNNHFYYAEDFKLYDFIFVSESISSSDTDDLKGAPVPIFYTELWSSKWDITGWVPTNTSTTYYENSPEQLVTIVNGDHPLAAGYPTGTELIIADGTNDPNGSILTYSVPQVDHIPIAVLSADVTRVVVMGVEKGTVLYNAENVKDGSMVSENRCAAVGINATANDFITNEGFQLIQAGIQWILEDETAIESKTRPVADGFSLNQNYPNPFNPYTDISFALPEAGETTLTVHNALGELVTVLVNEKLEQGTHHVRFHADQLPSGLYLYQMRSGQFHQVRKMMLME
ncbi:T9SS type A sorting domain-containing protein [bacterium]|nr:T9SS type A sorting domain-containing protein [bacterium]